MEEKLKEVQLLMELEKQKRSTAQVDPTNKEGTKWRSATTNQNIRGYDKAVISHVEKTKTLPPKQQPSKSSATSVDNPFVPGLPPVQKSDKLQNNLAKAL